MFNTVYIACAMIRTTINKVETLNDKIKRLHCNDDVLIDVYSPLFSVTENCSIIIKHSSEPIANPGYMIQGNAYRVRENMSCISCGGMLVKLPVSMKMMQKIYIDLQHDSKKGKTPVVKRNSGVEDMDIDRVPTSNTRTTRSNKRSR